MIPLLRDTGCLFVTQRRRVDRRRRAEASAQGAHAQRFRRGRAAVPRRRRHAVADVRAVHAVDDARRVRRAARSARGAGPRRAGRADPARHPPAGDGGVAAARARRHSPRGVAVRCGVADVAVAPSRSARRRSAGGCHATGRGSVSAMPRAEVFARDCRARARSRRSAGGSARARRRRAPVPYVTEPWYCCAEPMEIV